MITEQATIEKLKAEGHKVTTASNWTFGRIASALVTEHDWTDQQVADEFGKSQQSVNYARRIFERFYPRGGKVNFVWREWKQIVAWQDADKCLDWAEEQDATFGEMAAWRRIQNGEDIRQPVTPTPAANLTAEDLPATETKDERQEPVVRPESTTKHTPATQKTPEAEKSKTQAMSIVDVSVDAIGNLRTALADIQAAISEQKQRKQIARDLRDAADELDPPSIVSAESATWPKSLDTPEARAALDQWIDYRRREKKPLKTLKTVNALLSKWASKGPARFVAAVNHSEGNFQGLFEPSGADRQVKSETARVRGTDWSKYDEE